MNKLKYVARLQAIFSQYPNVYLHPKCMEEILTFTIATGNEARFLCTLERYLRFMHNNDISLWVKKDGIEKLKNCNANLWSMHFEGAYNLRILFSVTNDGTLLLHTFYERGAKSFTGYESHIPFAITRLNEMHK